MAPCPSYLLELGHLSSSPPTLGLGLTPLAPLVLRPQTQPGITPPTSLPLQLQICILLVLFLWRILPYTDVNKYNGLQGQIGLVNDKFNKTLQGLSF